MEFTPDFADQVSKPSIPDVNLRAQSLTEGAFQDPVKTASQVPPAERPLSAYFDDILSNVRAQNQAMVEYNMVQSLRASSKVDPEIAGQRQRIAQRLGVDIGSITGDLDVAKEMDAERQLRNSELARQFPIISSQLADINFANVAHDDIENLYKSEKSFQGLRKSFERGELTNDLGYLGARMLRSKLSGEDVSSEDLRRADWMKYRLNRLGESSGVWENVSEVIGQMASTIPAVIGAGWAGGKIGALGGPEAAPIGAAIGAGTAAFTQSAIIEGGNAYLDMIQMGLNPDAAANAAIGVGLVNGVLELVGEELTFGFASGARRLLSKKMTQEVAKAMLERTGAKAVKTFAGKYIMGGTAEVLTEVLQEVSNIKAEQYAASKTMGPTLPQEDIGDRLAAIAKKTALAMVVLGGVGPGARLALDAHEARAAIKRSQHFADLQEAVSNDKVKDRNPKAYRDAMQAVADGNDVGTLHVEGEAMGEVLRSLKITPEEFAAKYPELAAQVANMQAGETVQIPTGVYAEKIAKSDLGKELVKHIKLDPEGFSQAEAMEVMANLPEMGAEAEAIQEQQDAKDAAFGESAKEVEDLIYEQALATGVVNKVQARTVATLYRDFVIIQAADNNQLPMEWHSSGGVKFAAKATSVAPETVQQAPVVEPGAAPVVAVPTVEGGIPTEAVTATPATPPGVVTSRKATRVAGTYNPRTRVIDLTQSSVDGQELTPEVLIHELGHFFLETLLDTAYLNTADLDGDAVLDRTSSIADSLLQFFGIQGATAKERIGNWQNMSLEQRRKPHELFAYSLEEYMWTGKPPTEELRTVFQQIMHWFRRAYASLRDIAQAYKAETSIINLDEKLRSGQIDAAQHGRDLAEIQAGNFDKYGEDLPALTHNVRQVFDRIFASEEQIRKAKMVRGYVAAFQTKEDFLKAGNTEEEWDEYQQIVAEADFQAYDAMMKKSLANVRWLSRAKAKELRERAEAYREIRKRIRSEVENDLHGKPVYRARLWLKTGKVQDEFGQILDQEPDANHSLSLDIVQDIVPDGTNTQDLHRHMKPKGQNPDLVAPLFGFNNGVEMVLALLNEPSFKDAVESITDARMLAEHADYVEGTKEHAAAIDSAIHNEARTRMVAAQLAHISKAKKPFRIMLAAAKVAARMQLEKMTIADIKPRNHSIAEAKASREVAKALKEGKETRAIEWARKELLQNQLATQAHEVRDEIRDALKMFDKFFRSDERLSKSRDMSLIMAGRAILAAFSIGDSGVLPLEHVEKLRQYNGDLYNQILPLIAKSTTKAAGQVVDYKNVLTLEEFRALHDNMITIWEQSLRQRQWGDANERVALDAVVNELNARLDKLGVPKIERKSADDSKKLWRKVMNARAHLRRVEHWADAMGPEFTKYIWGRIKTATDQYTADSRKYLDRFVESMRELKISPKEIISTEDELNYTFNSKAELLGLLLHSGNDSNLRKLLLGRFGNQSIEDVDARYQDAQARYRKFLDRMFAEGQLTEADVRFVQSVHALTADLLPLLQQAHWNRYGRYFDVVELHNFVTPYGVIRGYVPATTDKYLVRQSRNEVSMEEQADEFMKRIPSVPSSMVKERVENYWKELSLDVRLIGKHINDTLLFVHMGSAVNDVMKILNDEKFAAKMDAFDPTVINEMLIPWLQTVAKQTTNRRGNVEVVDMLFNALRKRSAMSALFGNIANALQQATGLFPAMLKVKPSVLMDALWKVTRNPKDIAKTISEKSEFMREMMDNKIRHLRRDAEYILTNPSKMQRLGEWSEAHTMYLLNAVQNPVSMATWLGAYNQSLSESDTSLSDEEAEIEAVRAADAAVSMTQGSSAPIDVARIQVGTQFQQAMMQFTGYFNMLANLNATEYQKVVREFGWKSGKKQILSRGFAIYMLGFALPGLISDAIARTFAGQWGKDEDDDDMPIFLDWFFGSQFRAAASMIPVLGPVVATAVKYAIGGRSMDAHMPLAPSIRTVETMYRAVGATRNLVVGEKEVTGRNYRDWASALSFILDMPLTIPAMPFGYAYDVERGAVTPQEYLGLPPTVDYVRGLMTGSASAGSSKGGR